MFGEPHKYDAGVHLAPIVRFAERLALNCGVRVLTNCEGRRASFSWLGGTL